MDKIQKFKSYKRGFDESNLDKNIPRAKVSKGFTSVLAVVSILAFIGIISQTLFAFDLEAYIESAWMMVVGLGLLIESRIRRLRMLKYGLDSENFTNLVTIIIAGIAFLTGILSLPYFGITNLAFFAVKGILAILAIVIIIVQTWIVDTFPDISDRHKKIR